MDTLFILSKSPWARRDMDEWVGRVGPADGLLLIQDAVLALRGAPERVSRGFRALEGRLFALEADLAARGIDPGRASAVDERGVVELIAGAQRVLAI